VKSKRFVPKTVNGVIRRKKGKEEHREREVVVNSVVM